MDFHPQNRSLTDLFVDQMLFKFVEVVRRRSAKKGGLRNMIIPIDDGIGLRILATGTFEATTMDGIDLLFGEGLIRSDGIALDIGANIGVYSIFFGRRCQQVVSFEANPVTHKILEVNVAMAHLANVTCLWCGASDSKGTARLQVPKNGQLGWATFDVKDVPGGTDSVDVPIDTVDSVMQRIGLADERVSVIKIDVERHEPAVLRGVTQVLKKWQPAVLLETSAGAAAESCYRLLHSLGYRKFLRFRRLRGAYELLSPARVVAEPIDMLVGEGDWGHLICALHERAAAELESEIHPASPIIVPPDRPIDSVLGPLSEAGRETGLEPGLASPQQNGRRP